MIERFIVAAAIASAVLLPIGDVEAVDAPGTPGAPVAQAGDSQAVVAVPAPTSGGEVATYTVTASPGSQTCSIDNTTAPTSTGRICTITGLSNGTAYTFTATATNASGVSPASVASDPVTPAAEAITGLLAYGRMAGCAERGAALSPDGRYLYVTERVGTGSDWTGELTKIRTSDMTRVGSTGPISVVDCLYSRTAAAIDPTGEIMLVGAYRGMAKIDLNGASDAAPVLIAQEAGREYFADPAVDPNGQYAYFLAQASTNRGVIEKWSLNDSPTMTRAESAEFDMRVGASVTISGGTGFVGYVATRSPDVSATRRFTPNSSTSAAVTLFTPSTYAGAWITEMTAATNGRVYTGAYTGGRFDMVTVASPASPTDLLSSIPATCSNKINAIAVSSDGGTLTIATDFASPLPACVVRYTIDPATGAISDPIVTTSALSTSFSRIGWMINSTNGQVGYLYDNNGFRVISLQLAQPPLGLADSSTTAPTDAASGGTVDVSWSPPTNTGGLPITGYLVEIATSPTGPWTDPAGTCASATTTTSTTTTCIITGLTNGSQYYTRHATVNAAGATLSGSRSVSAAVTPTGPPAAPTGPASTLDDAALTVEWTAPNDTGGLPITGYLVEIAASPNGPWTDPAGTCASATTTTSTATTCTITGLNNGTTYYTRHATVNAAGTTPTADRSTSTGVAPGVAADSPTGLDTTTSDRSLTLNWTAPTDNGGLPITGYLIEIATSPTGPWTDPTGTCAAATTTTSTATTCTITGLTNGTQYYTRIATINAAGTGAFASGGSASAPSRSPGAPTDVSVGSSEDGVTVTWSAPSDDGGSDVTGYRVTITGPNGETTDLGDHCTSSTPSCSITGLTAGTEYVISVVAINARGESTVVTHRYTTPETIQAEPPAGSPVNPSDSSMTSSDMPAALTAPGVPAATDENLALPSTGIGRGSQSSLAVLVIALGGLAMLIIRRDDRPRVE